jgi:hypothetical protein
MFITFTFSEKKVNRLDKTECRSKLHNWLKHQKKLSPDLKYLIVPELHKDGAIHFHALFKNFTQPLTPAISPNTGQKLTRSGKPLYNLTNYKLGHSTLTIIPQEDLLRVSNYVKKYITKDLAAEFNKKRYWISKNLIKPIKQTNPEIDEMTFIANILPNSDIYKNESLTIYTVNYNMHSQLNLKGPQPCQTILKKQQSKILLRT